MAFPQHNNDNDIRIRIQDNSLSKYWNNEDDNNDDKKNHRNNKYDYRICRSILL